MGRRSRSRSASHSPSRRRDHHHRTSSRRDEQDAPSSSMRGSSHRSGSRRSRSRSRSPPQSSASRQHRHGGGSSSSRRRSSSDLDASDAHRKRARTDAHERSVAASSSTAASTSATGDASVKANTVEKNGEISMSIEETNRVRAALGLKPLSLGPSRTAKDANIVNLQKTSAQVDAERERTELQRKLAQSKKRRELTQKLAGQSIGEQLQASAAASALDWVKQSRKRVDAAAATVDASRADAAVSDAAYDASALAGLVVGHDTAAFNEGDEVVLTLQDARVLADDGNDVNDAPDALVNVELSEHERRTANQQQALRAQLPAYSGVDDDEFILMGGGAASRKKPVRAARLLAQYDDDANRRARIASQQFTLDATGGAVAAGSSSRDGAVRDDGDADDVAVVSLAIDKTKRMAEYLTPEEVAAQFAKAKSKKLRKKTKKTRSSAAAAASDGDGDGNQKLQTDAGDDAAALVQQLEAEALQHASRDRGRRRRRVTDDDDNDDDSALGAVEEAQLQRFQEARDRANASASSALSAMKRKRRVAAAADDADNPDVLAEAMDVELSTSLARTRRLAQLKDVAKSTPMTTMLSSDGGASRTSEERIAALVSQTVGMDAASLSPTTTITTADAPPSTAVVGHVFGAAPQTLGANGSTVVFNDATDFEARLKSAMAQRNAQFQAAATFDAAAALGLRPVASLSAANATRADADSDEEMKGDDASSSAVTPHGTSKAADANSDDGDDDDDGAGEVWGEEQPLVGAGMAATLALLRKTGELRETRVERQAGRANDARDRNVHDELRVRDGVKLDYRDEFGRLLTKKEAFRMLSYKFHGHEPGKKKKEKRLKALKEELEAQKLQSGEGSSTMMQVLEKKQKHAKQAHVVLSGGV